MLAILAINVATTQTWTSLNSKVSENLYSDYFTETSIGYAVGAKGTILKTINRGTNWTSQVLQINVALLIPGVYFVVAGGTYKKLVVE